MPTACDNSYLESDNVEELVVEGWIESGHAPVVMVSSTLPVSSTPQPLSDINEHILRYAEVYIEHNGEREYLTARLTDKFAVGNYFTSPSLRGVPGERNCQPGQFRRWSVERARKPQGECHRSHRILGRLRHRHKGTDLPMRLKCTKQALRTNGR